MTSLDSRLPASADPHWAEISELLGAGLSSLDITPAERELAVRRYTDLGAVIGELWDGNRGEDRVFTQGSFRLGTVTRRTNATDDIDIDCVAQRDVQRTSISQQQLKLDVGVAVYDYAGRPEADSPVVSESDRCWTLSWPGMHLDILPAIPAEERAGLLIPDRAVRQWQHSNPEGYAVWFHGRMREELRAEELRLAKALEAEEVPAWRVKTSLQRSVQALKRHRDLYFEGRSRQRPASIVITTLAARAYRKGGPLLSVLEEITRTMPSYLTWNGEEWLLPNPVEPDENFCDYWNVEPDLADRFFEWMAAAQKDFAQLRTTSGLDQVSENLAHSFGSRVADRAMSAAASPLTAARRAGTVGVAAGTGGLTVLAPTAALATTKPARPNQFHGGPAH